MSATTLATTVFSATAIYALSRAIYLLYFHPLARFPGPRLAAVSNLWYAHHWFSGRWPWAVERALRDYGSAVRIAASELAFFTPQAFTDIYLPQYKNMEDFVKTDFQNRGKNLGGLAWEEDPAQHREVARQMAPAFSRRFQSNGGGLSGADHPGSVDRLKPCHHATTMHESLSAPAS